MSNEPEKIRPERKVIRLELSLRECLAIALALSIRNEPDPMQPYWKSAWDKFVKALDDQLLDEPDDLKPDARAGGCPSDRPLG